MFRKIIDKGYRILYDRYFFDHGIGRKISNPNLVTNEKPFFYIIFRQDGGSGFFSNVLHVFRHIQIAKQLNLVPVVDFLNYPTIYSLDNNSCHNDSWANYFEPVSSYTLETVYLSENFVLCNGDFPPNASMAYDNGNKTALKLFKDSIKVRAELLHEVEKRLFEIGIKSKKTLGVHWRGGEQNRAKGHSFGATRKQIFKQIDYLLSINNYEQIFISTEISKYLELAKKRYGSRIVYNDHFRSNKNAYKFNVRPDHYYLLGKEILIDALILSKCHGLIHTDSNVSSFATFINDNNYENRITIDNGVNKEDYLSIIRFSYKKYFPHKIGGLSNNIIYYNYDPSK